MSFQRFDDNPDHVYCWSDGKFVFINDNFGGATKVRECAMFEIATEMAVRLGFWYFVHKWWTMRAWPWLEWKSGIWWLLWKTGLVKDE